MKLFAIIFFSSSMALASLRVDCKLFEDNPKPKGLVEIAAFSTATFNMQSFSDSMNIGDANVHTSNSHGFHTTVNLTEVVHSNGVVWGGKIKTRVGSFEKSTSSCFYKGVGYHLFEDSNKRELALHCKISAIPSANQMLDQKRADLLRGKPAEVCVRGGTSSTSGSRYN